MTEVKHTPLRTGYIGREVLDSLGNIYAKTYSPEKASHIVKCVNMHDELVEALKTARLFIEGEYRDPSSELDGEILSREARSIHKVLCGIIAKAGEL